jgi:DNA-binding NtrC family response regulator
MAKPTILIAESDEGLCRILKSSLTSHGYQVIESPDKTSTVRYLQTRTPDVVIVGHCQDQTPNDLEITHQIRKLDRRLLIILITPTHTDELILAALRAGVKDYLKYPFPVGELLGSVERCLDNHLSRKHSKSQLVASSTINGSWMIGGSGGMKEVRAFIEKVSSTDSNVLVTGETGTGKELVAELIHMTSSRRQNPMVSINCAAIPDGLLESELFGYEKGAFTGAHSSCEGKLKLAEGGTVFFDEIGDMSPYAQAKILRAIESRQIHQLGGRRSISLNIRIIAATNQDLEARVADGKIRKDLYYRLSVARIHLPPLRERKEDIPALLEYYLATSNQVFGRQVKGFTDEVLENLLCYDWPGNIRELRNLLEAIFIGRPSHVISASDLPLQYRNKFRDQTMGPEERERMLSALSSTNWNKSMAAQKLQWSRMTLYRKMAKYRLTTRPVDITKV